jgi:hypothetical protein
VLFWLVISVCFVQAGGFTTQGLANTLWAHATLMTPPPEALMRALSERVVKQSKDCKPQVLKVCLLVVKSVSWW